MRKRKIKYLLIKFRLNQRMTLNRSKNLRKTLRRRSERVWVTPVSKDRHLM